MIMVCGLSLRYWAARVLGEFYTRTLQTVADQKIIDKAPYSVVRHPGYLGTFLLSIGAGLALMNWLVLVVSVAIEMTAKAYRIRVEEQMLTTTFGDEFDEYVSKTWKLLPYLY
ncbi:MAG: methyltransferase family protein [Phormidesmis sp.]